LNIGWLASLAPIRQKAFLTALSEKEIEALYWHWPFWARADQLPPDGAWTSWMMLGGRGAGKTRAGAEWIRSLVETENPQKACRHIALIGENYGAARAVMVEGPSGLLAVSRPDFRPRFLPSRQLLVWPNGAEARLFSAERPEALRGPQFDAAWCDELAKWRYDDKTWDMLQFGLRLGAQPRQVVTTTPRPTRLIKALLADPKCVVTRSTTQDNQANLAPGFFDDIVAKYRDTRLGRQELEAQLLEDNRGALWSRALIDRQRCHQAPAMDTVVVALDPPAGSGPKADACGIIVIGLVNNNKTASDGKLASDAKAYVLADRTVQGLGPTGWAQIVVACYREFRADYLVAEVNQGGELVREIVLRQDRSINYRPVRAVKGKLMRAEPVAALYERGLVFHLGRLDSLEDELCAYTGAGQSPDRMDALVWGISWLMLRKQQETAPTIRRI
jgi:phage terminase large subunit-like protein